MARVFRWLCGAVGLGLAVGASADVPYGYDDADYYNVLVSVQISLGEPWSNRFQIDQANTKVSFT
ncbi:MAG: hypothetical protein AB7F50_11215 [Fimbriimonadaceae bacterium]